MEKPGVAKSRQGSRRAEVYRKTSETEIRVEIDLDGQGSFGGKSGIPFFDHLLCQLAKHGLLDICLEVRGDLEVDGHHTVEDIGIVLGQALAQAWGSKEGINRYGSIILPMDEALVLVALDLSGRPYLDYQVDIEVERLGDLETELLEEFLRALVNQAGITLHVRKLSGRNGHHVAEALFKALGRALRQAVSRDACVEGIPSTKGLL